MNHNINNDISHYVSAENVENIRERFERILGHFKFNINKASQLMLMSPSTLNKFIIDRKDISFAELIRVDDFVIEMERSIKESFK